jgi:hypothetical protein
MVLSAEMKTIIHMLLCLCVYECAGSIVVLLVQIKSIEICQRSGNQLSEELQLGSCESVRK